MSPVAIPIDDSASVHSPSHPNISTQTHASQSVSSQYGTRQASPCIERKPDGHVHLLAHASTNQAGPPNFSPEQQPRALKPAQQEDLDMDDMHFCDAVTQAIALQQAGRELGFDLPLHCYMKDAWRLDQWIKQQSKGVIPTLLLGSVQQ
ncbi:hypothetical protein IQ07DRAFT_681674 [Pyrenochaeta sp. DS3sAY3a]|nr:hypothetical protein IQ07DRAFT_681674 [Pyrenochaeta sp. DS3sAY3a]